MSDLLTPRPMALAEVADLVRRARAAARVPPATPPGTARDRFAVGDRVRRTAFLPHLVTRARTGLVVGFGTHPSIVRVRLDGNRTAASWPMACWTATGERGDVAAMPDRPARAPRASFASVMVTRAELRDLHREAIAQNVSLSKMLRGRVFGDDAAAQALVRLGACAVALHAASTAEDDAGVQRAQAELDDAALAYAALTKERTR